MQAGFAMVERERQHSWSEYLDKSRKDKLFVRYVFMPDFSGIEEFAVIYLTAIEGKVYEVVRYDCSKREAVNVHHFFYKKPKKRFLDKEKSFETLQELVKCLRKDWRLYRARFLEKTNI